MFEIRCCVHFIIHFIQHSYSIHKNNLACSVPELNAPSGNFVWNRMIWVVDLTRRRYFEQNRVSYRVSWSDPYRRSLALSTKWSSDNNIRAVWYSASEPSCSAWLSRRPIRYLNSPTTHLPPPHRRSPRPPSIRWRPNVWEWIIRESTAMMELSSRSGDLCTILVLVGGA